MRTVSLLAVFALVAACERPLSTEGEEEVVAGETLGTFTAQAGEPGQGGYELMQGAASFEVLPGPDGASVFVLRLFSTLTAREDSTLIDLGRFGAAPPPAGAYSLADPARAESNFSEAFAAIYRSLNLETGLFRSESGVLVVEEADAQHVKGSFDMMTYGLVQTGPDAFTRIRIPVAGAFNAERRPTGVQPGRLF